MKILFFVAKFPCTSETFVLNQVTSMLDRGHDVRIYSWGKGDKSCNHKDIEKYGLRSKIIYMDMEVPKSHVIRLLKIVPRFLNMLVKYGWKIYRLFLPKYGHPLLSKNLMQCYIAQRFLKWSWNPDVIVSHFGDNGIVISSLRNSGVIPQGIKCLTFFHAHEICRMSIEEVARFYKPMFNDDDILLPINHLWEKKLIKAGANPQKIKLLHMGVDLKRFNYVESNEISDTINILSVGRLCGQKGFEYAINGVVEFAKKTKKNISYRIIGEGALGKKLKTLVENLEAENYINFLGAQPQQIVAKEMQKANVFLLPSVTDEDGFMEGIPVAIMEAMARGLLCVSTYHSGIPELIEDGKNGFLCKEKDSTGIAVALGKIEMLTFDQMNEIRRNARRIIERDFDVCKETEKLMNLIEKG